MVLLSCSVIIFDSDASMRFWSQSYYNDWIWLMWCHRMLLPSCVLASMIQRSPYSCSHMVCLLTKYHILHTLIFSTAYPKKLLVLTSTYVYFSTASPNIVHKKQLKISTRTYSATSSPPIATPVQLTSFRPTGRHTTLENVRQWPCFRGVELDNKINLSFWCVTRT